MVKFGYNVNAIRIQRHVYFTFRNMQEKYHKRNSWIEVSNETVPKPKIRKWIKWFPKHSQSFASCPISGYAISEGLISEKWVKGQLILGVIFSFLAIIVTDTAFAF